MADYLLDADVIIDYLKGIDSGVRLIRKLRDDHLCINTVVWAEIAFGIKKSFNPDKRFQQFSDLLKFSGIEIYSIDRQCAEKFINLKIDLEKKGRKLADFDLLIAATALTRKLTLVTRNKKHFTDIPDLIIY